MATFCCLPSSQLCSFAGSITSLKHGHPTWRVADTHRVHTNLYIYQLYPNFPSWHPDEQVIATGTLTCHFSHIIFCHPWTPWEESISWQGVRCQRMTQAERVFAITHGQKSEQAKYNSKLGLLVCSYLMAPLSVCTLLCLWARVYSGCSAPFACILGWSL